MIAENARFAIIKMVENYNYNYYYMKYIQNFIDSRSHLVGKKSNKGLAHRSMTEGFTLLELLLVVAGIAILATLIFVVLNPATTIGKVNDAKRATDVDTILSAMQLYSLDNNGDVPNKASTGWTASDQIICTGTTSSPPAESCPGGGLGLVDLLTISKYMISVPTDPTDGSLIIPNEDTGYRVKIDGYGVVTITAPGATNPPITATGKFNPI